MCPNDGGSLSLYRPLWGSNGCLLRPSQPKTADLKIWRENNKIKFTNLIFFLPLIFFIDGNAGHGYNFQQGLPMLIFLVVLSRYKLFFATIYAFQVWNITTAISIGEEAS